MVPHRVKRKWVLYIDYINGKDSVSLLEKRNPFSCAPIYGFEIASIKGPWNISIRKMYAIPPRKDGPQAGQRPFIMPFRLVCEFLYVKGEFQRNSPAHKPDNKHFYAFSACGRLPYPKMSMQFTGQTSAHAPQPTHFSGSMEARKLSTWMASY